MKTYTLSAELYEAVINYLASKPFAEVGQVMPTLLAIKPDDAPEPEPSA